MWNIVGLLFKNAIQCQSNIQVEYCGNCGFSALFKHLKKKIETEIRDVEVVGIDSEQPGVFDIKLIKDGKEILIHSKSKHGRVHL